MKPTYSIRHKTVKRWHCGADGKRLVTDEVNQALDAYLDLKAKGYDVEIIRNDDEEYSAHPR